MKLLMLACYVTCMHSLSISKDSKSSDMVVSITGTKSGRNFDFLLKGNHLRVSPTNSGKGSADWYEALTKKERVDVMNRVLAEYRLPSQHSQLWKVAAIGIFRNPEGDAKPEKRHLIYVGVNSDFRADELNKDCAEQHMIMSANASMAQYQYHKRGVHLSAKQWPVEMHVMGGREPDPDVPDDKGQNHAALCGPCTDTCGTNMRPDAKVFIYPKNNGNMPLDINDSWQTITEMKGNLVWETTIDHLNGNRRLKLSDKHAAMQREGLDVLIEELITPPKPISEEVAEQAKQNLLARRRSVPQLDIAIQNGTCSPSALNDYMHELIVETLRSRMKAANIEATPDAVRTWLQRQHMQVDVTVAQYSDGTFTSGLEPSRRESAQQNAELSALGSTDGVIKAGESHITHLFTQRFSMHDIEQGFTSLPSKDGLERAAKRANGKEVLLGNIPFNRGGLSDAEVEELSEPYSPTFAKQFPGGFKGGWRGGATRPSERTWVKQ